MNYSSSPRKNLFQAIDEMLQNGLDPASQEYALWELYGVQYAVLVLDSSGFTRVSKEYGPVYFLSRLATVRRILLPVLSNYKCLDYHTKNDNIFAFFDNPQSALDAAQAANSAVYHEQLMLTQEERFFLSAGIGYGNLLRSETEEGYFGNEMNLASKLGEDMANPNEILVTQSVYDQLSPNQKKEFIGKKLVGSGVRITYYETRCRNDHDFEGTKNMVE